MKAGALSGIRVLDLADASAAFAGRLLADLGAEVILVEPGMGAPIRHRGPFAGERADPERAYAHLYFNANKHSVALDPTRAEDQDDFRGLVASADVLIETAPVSERAARGLAPEVLQALNPGLIHASITPFGPEGEWRDWRANDLVAEAASGLLWLCGERRGPPWHGSGRPAYSMASLAAATGIMAALTARERRGSGAPGAHLEVALQEAASMAAIQSATPTFWSWFGRIPGRPGLSNALQCRDGGWVGLLVRPVSFANFRDWAIEAKTPTQLSPDDDHWAEIYAPREGNPVAQVLRELAERYDRDAFADRAAEAETICLPIMDFPSMEHHPQFSGNQQFVGVKHELLGETFSFTRSPVDSVTGGVALRSAPTFGADSARVLETTRAKAPVSASPTPALDPYKALDGIRVVDFCWVLAGPLGTRLLANFGADVIRVESSRRIDGMRKQSGPDGEPHADLGGLFNGANAGKRSLTLDLSSPRGREIILDLIAQADVVTNNFRPGALDRMGLGFETLRARKSDIVLLNLPGTHAEGPWSQRPTTGNAVMGAAGLNMLMGFPHQRPRGYGVAYPDFTSPYLLATCTMAALRLRDQTGEARAMDLSQLSGTLSLVGPEWMQYAHTREAPQRSANRDPAYAPHGLFPAQGEDEWIALAVEGDEEWRALCRAMTRPELAEDPRFAEHTARKKNEDELDALMASWTAENERFVLAERLQAAGIAAAPVENLRDTYERDPQLRAHYQRIQHPLAPDLDFPVDREAIRFAGVEHQISRAPMWGEHNEEIVREVLGLSEADYIQLVLDGVLS
ncbi:MAG: CoA transferase [Myxococcota bacterium]|nr:CoA transferase [Myxococcota bacterium]